MTTDDVTAGRVELHPGEDTSRTCANCACSFVVLKPKIMPGFMKREMFDSMPDRQRVCRLNPPSIVRSQAGQGLSQQPVMDGNVCWQWKAVGTLPGNHAPIEFDAGRDLAHI